MGRKPSRKTICEQSLDPREIGKGVKKFILYICLWCPLVVVMSVSPRVLAVEKAAGAGVYSAGRAARETYRGGKIGMPGDQETGMPGDQDAERPGVHDTEMANDRENGYSRGKSILDTLFTLKEVEVVANRREEPVMPVQRLEGAQLDQLSVNSVADAVRYFSGVQIKDYGGVGGLKTVDIRSMGTHHLGVFYDGIEVGNAQNGIVDLGKFSMDNVEEISLYNGQKAELLQAAKDYGAAGTLYIKTRRPKFEGKNYNLMVGMKAGTFGLANPSILYEHKLSESVHLSLNAEYTYSTGRYHFRIHKLNPDKSVAWDTVGIRQNGDIQAFRGEAGIFGYLPEGKWHVKGYYYQSERGIPRAIVRNLWTSEQRQWDRNAFVQGAFQNTWDALSLLVQGKYSNDKMRYYNPDTTLYTIDNHFQQQELYLSAAMKYQIYDWWGVSVSGDYQLGWLDAAYNRTWQGYEVASTQHPVRHTGLVAAATQFKYKWISAQASVLGTFVRDMATSTNRCTPAVTLSYQPMLKEQLYLRAFYKNIFRMPTFNDLYYADLGNISLKPEDATQYDLGADWSHDFRTRDARCPGVRVHVKADGYCNQIRNKIVAIPKGNSQYRWQMMNIGYVVIWGADINASLEMLFQYDVKLSISGTYSYQSARDWTHPGEITYGGQIAYQPWHSGSVIGNVSWRGWALNYSFIYVGERYHNSANIRANYELPWYTHDLSISKLFQLNGWKLHTAVEINNLLNQQYDVVLNYPMPGINGRLVLKAII